MSLDLVVIDDIPTRGTSRNISRHIILRRAESAGRDDDVGSLQRISNRFLEPSFVIADYRLEFHLDADIHQLLREPQTIRVSSLRRQKFTSDGDDLCSKHF
jgi:hypothetical protein